MPKMIQIRDVPEEVHSILKSRAARDGMSLSDYLKRELEGTASQPHRAEQFVEALQLIPAKRYEHRPLLGRIWELRHNLTSYDATYISLAEATDAVLYTCDRRLERRHRAKVRVFARN